MSDKEDFKTRSITRNKEGYFIMIKGPSHQENRMNMTRATKYLKKTPTKLVRKRQVYNHSWGFYQPPSETNRTTRKIITKDIEDLNNTINHFDLIDSHRILYPTTIEYFFNEHGMFSKIYLILGHKICLHKCPKSKTLQNIFPDHKRIQKLVTIRYLKSLNSLK